jgi:uncharacterized membrane protein
MEILSIAVFLLLFLLFLFYPKYAFAVKFLTHYSRLASKKRRRLSGKTKFLCAVPFLNNALLNRVMGRKVHAVIDKTIGVMFCVVFLVTTVQQFFIEMNPWIILVSWIALMAIYALSWLNDAILAFRMAVLLERGHIGILCVLPPVCFYLLISGVASYFRRAKDELTGIFEPKYLDT